MSKPVIRIEIISDTICPWCFVGKRRLEKALQAFDRADFEIRWKPFFLDPSLPKEGVDKMTRYAEKFGSERIKAMIPHMQRVGVTEGINFSYGGKVANTLDSHRLIEWSNSFGKQDAVVEALFHAYFENEQNIGDIDTLVAAGETAGLDSGETRRFLESDELVELVRSEAAESSRIISGVPYFVINGRFQLSGAQEPDTFISTFERALR